MANLASCPTDAELRDLLLGMSAAAVGEHLLDCPQCGANAGRLVASDPMLAELRAAHETSEIGTDGTFVEELLRRIKQPSSAKTLPDAELAFLDPAKDEFPTDLGMFNHYRIVEKIGEGGMGMVFRAFDTNLQRTVALKIILPRYAANQKLRDRFIEEARATVKVRSPHVAEVYETNVWRDVPYLTMELLVGTTLDKKPKPMSADALRRIGYSIAKGLADAHRSGMIHRDLKPSNIHLGTDSRTGKPTIKLIDFGLARPVNREIEITKSGELLGTPAYMSPEQARGKKVDHRTDLYSLGVILHQLATGHLPYEGADAGVMAILTELATPEPLTSVSTRAANLPPALASLIDRLLAKDPANRPASADEVMKVLKASLGAKADPAGGTEVVESAPYVSISDQTAPPFGELATSPLTAVPVLEAKPTRQWLWPAVGVGALLAAVLIAAGLGAFRVKTKDGTIVLTDLPDDAEVLVDGGVAKLTWNDGEDAAEIRVPAGSRTVEVKVNGVTVTSEKVSLAVGETKPITVRYENPENAKNPAAPAAAAPGAVESRELVINGDCDEPLSVGWSIDSGKWIQKGFPNPIFCAGNCKFGQLHQDVAVDQYAADIDTGRVEFKVSVQLSSYDADRSRLQMTFRDKDGKHLATGYDTGEKAHRGKWVEYGDTVKAPAGTRTVRIALLSTMTPRTGNQQNSGYYDDVSLKALVRKPLPVRSMFGTNDTNGWTTTDPEAGGGVTDRFMGGFDAEHYLEASDKRVGDGKLWGFSAPKNYLGNQTDKFGAVLRYRLWVSKADKVNGFLVLLKGAGLSAVARATDFSHPEAGKWKSFSYTLDESTKWWLLKEDRFANADEIRKLLGNLESLWIRAEFHDGPDTARIAAVEFGVAKSGDTGTSIEGKDANSNVNPGTARSTISVQGKVRQVGDELSIEPENSPGNAHVSFGDPAWTDYDFAADVKGNGFLFFRVTDKENFWDYETVPDKPGYTCRMRVKSNGAFTRGPEIFNVLNTKADGWNRMMVSVRGPEAVCYFNDREVGRYTDARNPKGHVGLGAFRGEARFRNASVTTPDGKERFAGFPDLIGSPAPPAAKGFVPLFNGKDLAGWEKFGFPKGAWTVENGELVGNCPVNNNSDGSNLVTVKKDYRHFHLRLQTMKSDQATRKLASRVVFLDGPKDDGVNGYFKVLLGSPDDQDGKEVGRLVREKTEKYPLLASPKVAVNAWYTLEIIVQGNRVQVLVDGTKTANVTDNAIPAGGHCLNLTCAQGGTVRFRNIEIRELPAVAEPVTPPAPAIPDPFQNGTVWRGVKMIERGDFAGLSTFYEMTVDKRAGNDFTGSVWDNGPNRNPAKVAGTIDGNKIEWRESPLNNPAHFTAVAGTHEAGQLVLTTKGTFGNRGNAGRARLFRVRRANEIVPDEFHAIFDGRGLNDWESHPSQKDGWTINQSGKLIGKGNGVSHLYTKREFGDVHVWCRAKLNDGGNSGLFPRSTFGPGRGDFPQGLEAQLACNYPNNQPTGTLFAWGTKYVPGGPDTVKPNEWFTLEANVRGQTVQVLLNGKETVLFTDPVPRPKRGRIALQLHDAKTEVEFAMIAVKELK